MDDSIRALALELLEHGVDRLTPRDRRVLAHVATRRSLARDATAEYESRMTLGQRAADQLARWGGSWAFVGGFVALLVLWCGWNALGPDPFDPYPFIFLNLILSMLAAIQAPVIMMSQNRQTEIDRLQASHDYEVNLRAELEIGEIHEKLDRIQIGEIHAKLDRLAERLGPGPGPAG